MINFGWMNKRSRNNILVIFTLAISISLIGCERFRSPAAHDQEANRSTDVQSTPFLPDSVHLAFGNPTNAVSDPANKDNFLIVGEGSVISYNDSRGAANWVSWRTTKADLGNSIPRPDFRADPRLPNGFKRVQYYDYSGSGFDRGHMVPSADRFANKKLNEETFLMTNIVPQTGALNQEAWERFESYARKQAWNGNDVYQIAGVYGENGVLRNKITIPTNCWKVIAIVPRGKKIEDLDRRMRIIAVDMPNIFGIEDEPWERFKVTIRAIEEKAGMDLFSHLSRDVQDRLETTVEIRSLATNARMNEEK